MAMNDQEIQQALTVTSASGTGFTQWTDGLGNTGYWGDTYYKVAPYYPPTITVPFTQVLQAPWYCDDNCHVFGCQHAEACKCGKATRKVEPRVCPHCKKAHD